MAEILALTKAGRLTDATALIQCGLSLDATASFARTPADVRPPQDLYLPGPIAPSEAPAAKQATKPTASSNARFDRHVFTCAAGHLDYLLYVPAQLGPLPLVVMLHGCTQTGADFAAGTRMNDLADELGFIVAYPEQSRKANAQKCWNWFRSSDQGRTAGEPSMIAGLTREIIANYSVDETRVYVAGLSAGGAAASIMAANFPELYAAAGIHSGLACGSATDMPGAFSAMKGSGKKSRSNRSQQYVPLITFHGDRDSTVHPDNSEQIHAAWASSPAIKDLKREVTVGKSAGGRAFHKTALSDERGRSMAESWSVSGAGHAWSGGSPAGSYTDQSGPDASREMMRFFFQHRLD